MLVETASAKVNLFLHVVGRRADGYHLLDSLAVFPAVGDVLGAEPDERLSLSIDGPFALGLASEGDNLVLRAARALADRAGIAATGRIRLTKNLPVASGIGGGSADAAAALRLLVRFWRLDLPSRDLHELALRLGADVPVCLASAARRMQGVGEILAPAPALPPAGIVLVNPGVAVSTPEVFRLRAGPFSAPAILPESWQDAVAMAHDLRETGNDLEAAAIRCAPVIGDVLATLGGMPGCLLARMSGSGATCFGLFPTPEQAAASALAIDPPAWWRWGGGLR